MFCPHKVRKTDTLELELRGLCDTIRVLEMEPGSSGRETSNLNHEKSHFSSPPRISLNNSLGESQPPL